MLFALIGGLRIDAGEALTAASRSDPREPARRPDRYREWRIPGL